MKYFHVFTNTVLVLLNKSLHILPTHQVSLFAELFNEMLMRDFGFTMYKCLSAAPEKPKEEKKEKDKKKEDVS
jgi:hypothetical protein